MRGAHRPSGDAEQGRRRRLRRPRLLARRVDSSAHCPRTVRVTVRGSATLSEPTWREPTWRDRNWYPDAPFLIADLVAVAAGQPEWGEATPGGRRKRALLSDRLMTLAVGPRRRPLFLGDQGLIEPREPGAPRDPTGYLRSALDAVDPQATDRVIAAMPSVMERRMWFLGTRHGDQPPDEVGRVQHERVHRATGSEKLAELAGAAAKEGCERARMERTQLSGRPALDYWMNAQQLESADRLAKALGERRIGLWERSPLAREPERDVVRRYLAARLAVITAGLAEAANQEEVDFTVNDYRSATRAAGGIDEAVRIAFGLKIEPSSDSFMAEPSKIVAGRTLDYARWAVIHGLARRHPTDGGRVIQDLRPIEKALDRGLQKLRGEREEPDPGGPQIG